VTSISLILLLQFGQISIAGSTEHASVVLMTFPSPDKMSGRAKRLTLGLGACQSEKQELELARSLCDSGSITNIIVRPLFTSREKRSELRRWSRRRRRQALLHVVLAHHGYTCNAGPETPHHPPLIC